MRFLEFLLEQANFRKDVEGEITSLSKPVTEHLIKILKWEDKLNFQKHCNDIFGWLVDIQGYKLKGNKLPKQKDYYQWMFLDVASDIKQTKRWIQKLKNYHELNEIRTDEEVFYELERIFKRLSFDMSKNDLNNLENYL